MKLNIKNFLFSAALASMTLVGATSCLGDLDVKNINPKQVSELNQNALFNKLYSNLVLTGQTGPHGNSDLPDDIDEGASNMLRQIWSANELTTDEAHCLWGNEGIPEFNHNAWSDAHPMMQALYYRLYNGVTLANFFLSEATATDAETQTQRAEARFLRALHYYYLMDFYANVPILKRMNEDVPQGTRAELFAFIESELKDIVGEGQSGSEQLAAPRTTNYGRADKAAAWLLLSRLYLNAEVYTGTAQWENAKTYADKALKSGYALSTTPKNGYSAFQLLFMGDNDSNGAQNEILLPALHDGELTQTWGGVLFLIASGVEKAMIDSNANPDYIVTGTSENWGGNRTTKQFAEKFFGASEAPQGNTASSVAAAKDDRALFYTKGHKASIEDETNFKSGYAYVKFLNVHADGTKPKHTQFVDTDFPMLRLAEAYLTYAEADARLNGGRCTADGLNKVKALRQRANAADVSSVTLDDLCDEWCREFGFEGRRRMDLVRFGKFAGQSSYKWEWMGGTYEGSSLPAHYNIFAIPNSVINADGLKQNNGF